MPCLVGRVGRDGHGVVLSGHEARLSNSGYTVTVTVQLPQSCACDRREQGRSWRRRSRRPYVGCDAHPIAGIAILEPIGITDGSTADAPADGPTARGMALGA